MASPSRLILVKHAAVDVLPGRPPATWRLSAAGRARCADLADRLALFRPERITSSVEPKAQETAELVAAMLGIPFGTAPGLHEHDRRETPFLGAEAFDAAVPRFFAEPEALVLGQETAAAAARRFGRAVTAVAAESTGESCVIVAHGTVISLFAAAHAGVEPLALWRELSLPSFITLGWPDGTLEAVVRL